MRRPSQRATMHQCFASLPREVLPIMAKRHLETYAKSLALRARETTYAERVYLAARHARIASASYRVVLIMRQSAATACGTIYNPSTAEHRLFYNLPYLNIVSSRQDTRYTMVVVDLPSTTDYKYNAKALKSTVHNEGWRGRLKIVSVATAVLGGDTLHEAREKLVGMAQRTLQACPPCVT
jgi:hypothetical protein